MANNFVELFSFIILVIGLVLIAAHFNIDASIGSCQNRLVRQANRYILIISILAIMLTFGGLICRHNCECATGIYVSVPVYMSFLILLGGGILALGIIMKTQTKVGSSCNEVSAQGWINGVIITGSITMCVPLLYIGKLLKDIRNR